MPKGWSRPLKPSDVPELFPIAEWISWPGRAANWRESDALAVVWLRWHPNTAAPAYALTLYSVPSTQRNVIRRAIHTVVAKQAKEWFDSVVNVSDVARDSNHDMTWSWTGDEFTTPVHPLLSWP
jgi:hypothetical protein